MKKYFVTSDVHGYYDILMNELKKCGWEQNNPDHIFISCGDLLDRGSQPKECLQFVNDLPDSRKILIKGNHEVLLASAIRRGVFYGYDYSNGTVHTVYYLNNDDEKETSASKNYAYLVNVYESEDWKNYFYSTVPFALLPVKNKKYVFVHGWLPNYLTGKGSWNKLLNLIKHPENLIISDWEKDAMWANGMNSWSNGKLVDQDAIVVCGHFHTSWGHTYLHNYGMEFNEQDINDPEQHFEPFIDKGIIALDACCAWSSKLNVYVIEGE